MSRYFCHFMRDGALYEDTSGFEAADDADATNVMRAIAVVLLQNDPSAATATVALHTETGELVLTSSLGALATSLQ